MPKEMATKLKKLVNDEFIVGTSPPLLNKIESPKNVPLQFSPATLQAMGILFIHNKEDLRVITNL